MERHFVIPESTLNALVKYLAARPYAEVANGMEAIKALPEIDLKRVESEMTYAALHGGLKSSPSPIWGTGHAPPAEPDTLANQETDS